MAAPTITALYAAINAVLNVALAWRVSNLRRRDRVSLGTGESNDLLVAVRTHANSAEFVPLALLLMLIAELCGASSVPLHFYGGLLFAGRIAHVVGMPRKAPNPYRVAGTALTWGAIVLASVWVIFLRAHR
jgi:uncharacterized membrane protein YecN with MAPEG domain